MALSLTFLASVAFNRGDAGQAAALAEQGLTLARQLGDELWAPVCQVASVPG
jgi:hypothetical protein